MTDIDDLLNPAELLKFRELSSAIHGLEADLRAARLEVEVKTELVGRLKGELDAMRAMVNERAASTS